MKVFCDTNVVAEVISFMDLEDSYQYQAAIACGADVFLTINVKDFKEVGFGPLPIMTPADFAARFL